MVVVLYGFYLRIKMMECWIVYVFIFMVFVGFILVIVKFGLIGIFSDLGLVIWICFVFVFVFMFVVVVVLVV